MNTNSLIAFSKLNLTKSQKKVFDVLKETGVGMTMTQVCNALNCPKNAISGRFGELVRQDVLEVKSHTIENGSRVGVYTIKKKEEPDWDAMRLRAIERQKASITNYGPDSLYSL